jgi:hypothetical protein
VKQKKMIIGALQLAFLANSLVLLPAFAFDSASLSNITTKATPAPQQAELITPSSTPVESQASFQVAPTTPSENPKELLVPVETVLAIKLEQPLNSEQNKVGETVQATVTEAVYLGPYLAIPANSKVSGKITHVNAKRDELGRNPYIIVKFDTLQRPMDTAVLPFHSTLIAYKTGLRGQEYVWRLPRPGDRKRNAMKSVIGGALSGMFLNPIFGPPLGAGMALLKTSLTDKVARGGDVKIKANQVIPIAVDEPFNVTVTDVTTQAQSNVQGLPLN